MQTGKIKLEGINSREDANKVLQALNKVWGVRKAEVNLQDHEAIFNFNEKAASNEDFEQAVIDSGFGIVPTNEACQRGESIENL